MKNSEVLFRFFEDHIPSGEGTLRLSWEEFEEGRYSLFISVKDANNGPDRGAATFGVCRFEEPGEDGGARSGDPSPQINLLEERLKSTRGEFPDFPLLVCAKPDVSWSRSHAWALGEYLAERDLPCWVDLLDHHPARQLDWSTYLTSCGLPCPRLVLELSETISLEDLPGLEGTGAWVVRSQAGDSLVSVVQM